VVFWEAILSRNCHRLENMIAYFSGGLMEKFYSNFSIKGKPLLTRMAAELFGTNQGFPIEKERRELGYKPKVGFDEGMYRVKMWLEGIGFI